MSSSNDFAAGPDAPVAADSVSADDASVGADTSEPVEVGAGADDTKADGSLADLHRETAAMLRTLADRYDAEAADKRAVAARLRAESDANESLATQLADESSRIRVDADRLGTEPTWVGAATGDDVPSPAGPAHDEASDGGSATGDQASQAPSQAPSAWSTQSEGTSQATSVQSDQVGHSDEPAQSFSGVEPPPGPGPARGFAPNPDAGGEESKSTEAPTVSADTTGAPDDWAPRPFESWRNQTSRVIPRLLGL